MGMLYRKQPLESVVSWTLSAFLLKGLSSQRELEPKDKVTHA